MIKKGFPFPCRARKQQTESYIQRSARCSRSIGLQVQLQQYSKGKGVEIRGWRLLLSLLLLSLLVLYTTNVQEISLYNKSQKMVK